MLFWCDYTKRFAWRKNKLHFFRHTHSRWWRSTCAVAQITISIISWRASYLRMSTKLCRIRYDVCWLALRHTWRVLHTRWTNIEREILGLIIIIARTKGEASEWKMYVCVCVCWLLSRKTLLWMFHYILKNDIYTEFFFHVQILGILWARFFLLISKIYEL